MTNAIQTTNQSTAIAQQWSQSQVELIKSQIAPDATDEELMLFGQVCQRTGLDPFSRQIFAIHRNAKTDKGWVKKMTIQVSIDGYRAIADRTGQYTGSQTFWCGDDGHWQDVWLSSEPPAAAKVIVYKGNSTVGFEGVARFQAYAQTSKDGSLTSMWAKMPDVMIAKCAESQALRKAFPQQLGGMYTEDEMGQADNGATFEPTITSKEITALRNFISSNGITPDEAKAITNGKKADQILASEIDRVMDALTDLAESKNAAQEVEVVG